MDNTVAEKLISQGVEPMSQSNWADMGCGTGVFTIALANLLKNTSSTIYAIDMDKNALSRIPAHDSTTIIKIQNDFSSDVLNIPPIDGILMANSLHFIADQIHVLKNLKKLLTAHGKIIIVEYDIEKKNQWVPFPIARDRIKLLVEKAGFHSLKLLETFPSVFNNQNLYSALIK